MEEKIRELIEQYKKELNEAYNDINYYDGKKDVCIIFEEEYNDAVSKACILKSKINDLEHILEE